jgi:hypothetical protein
LCEKLKKRNYKFPIQSVERFSNPAQTDDLNALKDSGVDITCQELIPVEVCSVPECAEFCIDYDVRQKVAFGMTVQTDCFFSYEAEGSAFVTGVSPVSYTRILPDLPCTMSGGVSFSSGAFYQTDSYQGRGGAVLGGQAFSQSSSWSYVGGVWPSIRLPRYGTTNSNQIVNVGDQAWLLPERVNQNDMLFSQSDISFGRKTQSLLTFGFGTDLPSWATIIGIQVRVSRISTQVGVRDLSVYLVRNGSRISDNLANTTTDWPLIETERTYGSNSEVTWRDPENDDYVGPLTIDDLNDPTFGVEIRVGAISSLPATIAKINHINLEVYYEDANGSLIRMSGMAAHKSVSYHYAMSGKSVVRSVPVIARSFRYSGVGGFDLGGVGSITFDETMLGGASAGGEANVTPYFDTMLGGASAGGEANVTPYFDTMLGGASAGGKALRNYRLHYEALGGVVMGGSSYVPAIRFSYIPSGGPVLGSNIGVRSNFWKWLSDGNVVSILGQADQSPGNVVPPLTNMGFGMSLLQTTVSFLNDVDLQDAGILTTTVNKCDCTAVPLIIDLTQNIVRDNILSKFLIRNSYTIPKTVRMRYNQPNDSWQCNLHYRGKSAETGLSESWDLIFELQCTDVVGGIVIGRTIWKLSAQIIKKNLVSGDIFDSRILVGIIPDTICASNGGGLNFNISYNTQLNSVTIRPNAVVYQSTIYDNIGLFRNPTWINSPNLILKIAQSGAEKPIQRIDLTDAILV